MSGLEIAGLVLAIWPVMDGLLSAYSNAKDARSQKQLTNQLKIYRLLFRGFVDQLLLGDEELSDEARITLIEDSKGSSDTPWQDEALETRMRQRLGDETFDSIIFTLNEVFVGLKSLEGRLRRGDVDFSTVRGKFKSTYHHLKTSMPGSEFQKDMSKVQQSIENLRTLVDITKSPMYSSRSRQAPAAPRRLSGVHRQKKRLAAQYVNDFYDVLQGSFHCQCPEGHEANFRVYDDLFHILFGVEDMERSMSGMSLKSRPTFGTENTTVGLEGFQDGESPGDDGSTDPVYILTKSEAGSSSDVRTCWSRSRHNSVTSSSREHRTLPLLFSMNRPGSGGGVLPIPDMCRFVKKLEQTPPNSPSHIASIGTLGRGERSYTARMHGSLDAMKSTCVVCLDDHLSQTDEWQISRQRRVDIAQKLACSILQFWATSWIDSAWTWRNFSMNNEQHKRPQLFVTRTLYSVEAEPNQPKKLAKFWRFIPEPILVRLGFALIELAMGKRLSQLRTSMAKEDAQGTSEDEQDYDTAMELVEKNVLRDQIGDTYQAVVQACLTCIIIKDTGAMALTSLAETFQDDVEQHVVQPLQEYFNRNWASVVMAEA